MVGASSSWSRALVQISPSTFSVIGIAIGIGVSVLGAAWASSCKVYGVVPPPHQLLVGVQSSGNELNVKTSSNPCLTSSDGSSTPTPLVSSFDFVNSDLSFWCFSCDAYLDAQAIL
eukprot:XP_010658758.1 PREDICTED: uncharacterized protein LOC100243433 [Vitis vinifera]